MTTDAVCPQCGGRHVGRGGYIGSGDCAAIIGVSNPDYSTAVGVYERLTRDEQKEPSAPNEIQERGLILEPTIIDRFARRKGFEVVDRQAFRTITGVPFPIGSHIDGRVRETGALVEAKSAAFGQRDTYGEEGSDEVPETHLAQCAHHMAVHPDAPGVWIPVMFVGYVIREEWFYVPRDNQFVKDVLDAEVAFAEKHVLPRVPPPAVTRADVARLFPKDAGTAVEASTDVALAVNDLRALREKLKSLGEEAEAVEGKIAAALGPHALLTYEGLTIATYKTQSRRSLDAAAVKAAHPEIAAQFERETRFRVLRLKK